MSSNLNPHSWLALWGQWGGGKALGLAVAAAASAVLIPAAIAWRQRWERRRFVLAFQVLWDRQKTPHCPVCRSPLTEWQERTSVRFEKNTLGRTITVPTTFHAFACRTCDRLVRLLDADGYEVSLEQAREQLE